MNTSLYPTIDWEPVAVTEHTNRDTAGHYKSLTDVTKTPIINEDIDYKNHVGIKDEMRLLIFVDLFF